MERSDVSDGVSPRGFVVFPAEDSRAPQRSEWWLVPAAIVIAALLIAIAFAVR